MPPGVLLRLAGFEPGRCVSRSPFPALTPLPAPTPFALSRSRLRPSPPAWVFARPGGVMAPAPCIALAGTSGALLVSSLVITHPPSCPAFPQTGFAAPSFHGLRRIGTMRASCSSPDSHTPGEVSLLPLPCLQNIPSPTTSCTRRAVSHLSLPARPHKRGPGFVKR